MSRDRTNDHPLRMLFWSRGFTTPAGMNWLQERGLVSDLCIEVEEVPAPDFERVCKLAGAEWAICEWKPSSLPPDDN